MRLVLDTDVLLAALRSDRGASRQLLINALDRDIEVLVSVPLMLEYEAVLTRPEHLDASGHRATNCIEGTLTRPFFQAAPPTGLIA